MKRFFIISLLMLLWLPLPGEESAPQILVHLSGLTGEEGDRLADIGLTIPGLPAPEQTLLVSAGQLLQLRELGIPARVLPRPESEANILRPGYMDVAAIEALSDSLVGAFPNLVRKEVYGISVEGRELFALKISDNVHRDENEPEVGFDGCHHGDEALSAEVLMRMVRQMCLAYGKDAYLSSLIDEREIWVFPVVNPDGRETLDRRNARGVDLNRDWGYMWDAWGGSNTPYSQPETRAALSWLLDHQFAVLQSLHAGMEMISYPWSYSPHDSPDHQAIESLAQGYVNNSHYPELSHGPGFKNLYPINGNAKDSYYGIRGALGWTMELGAEKMPPAERINHFYDKNLPAMLHLIDAAGLGISGTVRSSLTGLPLAATVWVSRAGEDFWPVYSDPENGAFHKYLAPGNYRVRVSANGYLSASGEEIVVGERGAAHRDFYLEEGGGFFAHQVLACRIPGNNHADNGLTYQTLGEPDGRGYSLGRAGWIVVDMGERIYDNAGADFQVFEADEEPEGFRLAAAQSLFGPWISLGNGWAGTPFDLAETGLGWARYLKITDDGDGPAGGKNAGFDLDAVSAIAPGTFPLQLAGLKLVADNFPGGTSHLVATLFNKGEAPLSHFRLKMGEDPEGETEVEAVLAPGESLRLKGDWGGPEGSRIKVCLEAAQTGEFCLEAPLHQGGDARMTLSPSSLILSKNLSPRGFAGSFAIANSGGDTLLVTRPEKTGLLLEMLPGRLAIPPGEQRQAVFFHRATPFREEQLVLLSNDPLAPSRTVPIRFPGGTAPDLGLATDTVFIKAHPGQNLQSLLLLENRGWEKLEVTARPPALSPKEITLVRKAGFSGRNKTGSGSSGEAEIPQWMQIREQKVSLEPGQKTAMAVQVNARGLLTGTYHHTLQLASNDPRHPWINLPVVLEVVPEESGLTENGDLRLRAAQRCFLNPGARIEFHLKGEKRVTLRVYDSEGFRVASLLEQSLKSGDYQMVWEARDPSLNPLPGGLYFCEISVGKDKEVRKMILLQ